jgi:hypothetical protein
MQCFTLYHKKRGNLCLNLFLFYLSFVLSLPQLSPRQA